MHKRFLSGVFILTLITTLGGLTGIVYMVPEVGGGISFSEISNDPIQPSKPTNVVIREISNYQVAINDNLPIVEHTGIFYWEELSGNTLEFYINTSMVIDISILDYETKEPLQQQESCESVINCYSDLGDKYRIVPKGRSFQYQVRAYYEPDIVEDTGFYVIFDSQTVDVSLDSSDKLLTAKTDYYNRIILPEGAGIVSQSPMDEGFLGRDKIGDQHYALEWEYVNRDLHPHANPVMISVTYSFEDIYLAFTEEVYQEQIERERQRDQLNRLNAIKQSFTIIASFALLASIFSTFFAYLLARKRFEKELQNARELPKIEATDIESQESQNIPVRSEFREY